MELDIKTADHAIRDKTPVLYHGHKYTAKELIIWYDIENRRQCSLILTDDKNGSIRARMSECEVMENE